MRTVGMTPSGTPIRLDWPGTIGLIMWHNGFANTFKNQSASSITTCRHGWQQRLIPQWIWARASHLFRLKLVTLVRRRADSRWTRHWKTSSGWYKIFYWSRRLLVLERPRRELLVRRLKRPKLPRQPQPKARRPDPGAAEEETASRPEPEFPRLRARKT